MAPNQPIHNLSRSLARSLITQQCKCCATRQQKTTPFNSSNSTNTSTNTSRATNGHYCLTPLISQPVGPAIPPSSACPFRFPLPFSFPFVWLPPLSSVSLMQACIMPVCAVCVDVDVWTGGESLALAAAVRTGLGLEFPRFSAYSHQKG